MTNNAGSVLCHSGILQVSIGNLHKNDKYETSL